MTPARIYVSYSYWRKWSGSNPIIGPRFFRHLIDFPNNDIYTELIWEDYEEWLKEEQNSDNVYGYDSVLYTLIRVENLRYLNLPIQLDIIAGSYSGSIIIHNTVNYCDFQIPERKQLFDPSKPQSDNQLSLSFISL